MNKKKLKNPAAQKTKNITQNQTDTPIKDEGYIIFSLRHLQKSYCFSNCQPNEKQALADSLFKRREMTWLSISKEPKHGLGFEKISASSLNVTVPKLVPEGASILAFRFNGKAPMVGFKENNIFHILWLDRDYTVYTH